MVTFVQAIFVLTTNPILTQFFGGLNFFTPNIFSTQNFFSPKIFWEPSSLRLKKILTELFLIQHFFYSKLFQDNLKYDFLSTKLSFTQLGTTQPQLVLVFLNQFFFYFRNTVVFPPDNRILFLASSIMKKLYLMSRYAIKIKLSLFLTQK